MPTRTPRVEYKPTSLIAGRIARHLDENPPTTDAMCRVADALEVPVERFLIGERS